MTLSELIDEFLLYLSAVKGLSQNTSIGYGNDLEQLKAFLTPELDIRTITKENLVIPLWQKAFVLMVQDAVSDMMKGH